MGNFNDGLYGALNDDLSNIQVIKPTAPAAGVPFTLIPPSQYVYMVLAGSYVINNSATVASGVPSYQLIDPDGTVITNVVTQNQAGASSTLTANMSQDVSPTGQTNMLTLPKFHLWPGFGLRLMNAQMGGNITQTNIVLLVRRWFVGKGGYAMAGLPFPDLGDQ